MTRLHSPGSLLVIFCLFAASYGDGPAFKPPPIQAPPGFVVELVAAAPLVKYPMLAAFDERGRLFVGESAGFNLDAAALLEKRPNFIRRLEDTQGTGRFDKSTVFADGMTFPSGLLWHAGALYTASPPYLWRLEDTKGTGRADRRDALVGKFHFRGHAGDVHGPVQGPDGRLYLTDGTMGHEIRDTDGQLLSKGSMARIFAVQPDGRDLEVFCGGGMSNPVAITFTDDGEMLGVMTFYNPGRVRHDALVHYVYGGVYPKRHEALAREFKHTGPLMPALLRHGIVAPADVMQYRGGQFGPDYVGNLFISYFNTHSVSRVRLRRDGSTFRAEEEPFLVSTSPDFHPCQILEDADGSLLVIDTGGWFKIGCATTQLALPQIHGAIYRVRRTGGQAPADLRGLRIAWDTMAPPALARLLEDDRFAVRDRAVATLAQRGESAIASLKEILANGSTRARRHAVWVLTRIGSDGARVAIRAALNDADESVRLSAANSLASTRDAAALSRLAEMIGADVPVVKRAAAAALGRIGKREAVPALLSALGHAGDRMLEHALVFALIEIHDRDATLPGLRSASPLVQRRTLIALDQMDGGKLTRELVMSLARTSDKDLQGTVLQVAGRRPGWGDIAASPLKQWLGETALTDERQELLVATLTALDREPPVQDLIGDMLSDSRTPLANRLLLLDGIARGGKRPLPPNWGEALKRSLQSSEPHEAERAIAAMAALQAEAFEAALLKLARDEQRPGGQRVAAIGALGGQARPLADDLFRLLVRHCGPETAFDVRQEAARTLGLANLSAGQLADLLPLVTPAGALELPLLLAAFERSIQPELGPRLVAALAKAPGLANLTAAKLTSLLEKYPQTVKASAVPLIKRLTDDDDIQARRFVNLNVYASGGDPAHGKQVFFGKTALCSACHKVAGQGVEIGPDLSRIGQVRTRRDLLESILFPSASFARGFEPVVVTTRSGKVLDGIIGRETPDAVFLRTAQREEIRVPRAEIDAITPGSVSVMPAGVGRILTPDELRDLLAYLSSLK